MSVEISLLKKIDQDLLSSDISQIQTVDVCSNCASLKSENKSLRLQLEFLMSKTLADCAPVCPSDRESDIGNVSIPVSVPSVADSLAVNMTIPGLNVYNYNPETNEVVEPFTLMPGNPLSHIDPKQLSSEISFSRSGNRHTAYYGMYPYSYSGITHPARPLPANSTLLDAVKRVAELYPNIEFNSVLISKFSHGGEFLPYHQDNEQMISDMSQIITVTLGESRAVKFRALGNSETEISVTPTHGQAYVMSKSSQQFFQHSVPKSYGNKTRISLTFRLISPTVSSVGDKSGPLPGSSSCFLIPSENLTQTVTMNPLPKTPMRKPLLQPTGSSTPSVTNPTTLYISSSMFRHLDETKLSSTEQSARVFFYPGATAATMKERFNKDPRLKDLNLQQVNKVFILTGSNNVDGIKDDKSGGKRRAMEAEDDIRQLIAHLNDLLPNAMVNIMNILPRVFECRNVVINKLNDFIKSLCNESNKLKYVDTESDRHLFSYRGFRNNLYFVAPRHDIADNVHLNRLGVIRLARHIKYLAHNS